MKKYLYPGHGTNVENIYAIILGTQVRNEDRYKFNIYLSIKKEELEILREGTTDTFVNGWSIFKPV